MTTRYKGWTIWPILDDDSGRVGYYDIHEPCVEGCERRTIRRADGSLHPAKCECHYVIGSLSTATTIEEAKAIIDRDNPEWLSMRALERWGGLTR